MGKIELQVEIDEALLEQAKAAGIELTAVVERALRASLDSSPETGDRRAKAWVEENAEAIRDYNARIARRGIVGTDLRRW
jgi:post-segregation antitoxin (ccd killing protein)